MFINSFRAFLGEKEDMVMRLNFDKAVFFRDTYQSIVLITFGLGEIGNFYPSQYKLDSYFKSTLIVYRNKNSIVFLWHTFDKIKRKLKVGLGSNNSTSNISL